MRLLLRIMIFVLIGVFIVLVLVHSNPLYTKDDLYLVNGYCSDIQYERINAKNGSERIFIVMDGGERYYIYDNLWKELNGKQLNIIGYEISFWASDKGKHWFYDHLFIAFGSDANDCIDSIKLINKKNIGTQAIVLSLYCVMMCLFYLAPELLREMEKRDCVQKKVRRK